jgi:hypothetical protein
VPGRRVTRQLSTTGHLFAVIDDPADAARAMAALTKAGFAADDLTLLRGAEGAARIDATGARTGPAARLRQILSFTLVDQMPDFILYEAAIVDGRAVIGVRLTSGDARVKARDVLRAHGGHFINAYGRMATEEIDLWRGPELDIPGLLRR